MVPVPRATRRGIDEPFSLNCRGEHMAAQAEPTRTAPKPVEVGERPGKPSAILLIGLSIGYFMVLLDLTIVTVALPAMADTFKVGLDGLQWVTNGYTITFAALLLTAGWLTDRLGGRRVFLWGLVAFAVLSGISAAAASLPMLVVLRLALGIAGALLL